MNALAKYLEEEYNTFGNRVLGKNIYLLIYLLNHLEWLSDYFA